jgi:uroporphyrinogen decarboxylase
MNGKEIVIATLKHGDTPSIPWVPFAGVHAGKLVGYSAPDVLKDQGKMLESLLAVNRLYRPDGQPVVFDLQLEAEVLGCELKWAERNPPSVMSHPLAGTAEIPDRIPGRDEGRLPAVMKTTAALKKEIGGTTALYGLLCGPLTLASHLRGVNLFMDLIKRPEYVAGLLSYTAAVARQMASLYIDEGIDVVAAVDPLVSQISPAHFKKYLHEPYRHFFDYLRGRGVLSSLFVCGDATKNIEPMCATGPDSISVDENISLPKAKEITDRYNIAIGGNIPLTTVMLLGTQQDNMKAAVDLIDSVSHRNFILSPGCDMTYDIPVENAIAAEQAVHNTAKVRQMIENYRSDAADIKVELPDYGSLARPLVEVFTLDSESCAACQYMMASANDARSTFGDRVDVIEYKYTTKENIARVRAMGVKNLPSMYVNGELKFSSIIPGRDELMKVISEYV